MQEMIIRAADPHDVESVLALWAQARSPAAVTHDDAAGVRRLLDHPTSTLLVADQAGQIVGSLIVTWDGWRGNMYRLAVPRPYRRQGIASMLVERAHERLLAVGARRITALVADAEKDATGLWLGAGYERDEQISRFVRNLTA